MSQAANSLRLKYGLGHVPSEHEVDAWLEVVNRYIREGKDKDTAGRIAAQALFNDFQTNFFASEADTIETLLRLARKK